jgi:hypothetical protein
MVGLGSRSGHRPRYFVGWKEAVHLSRSNHRFNRTQFCLNGAAVVRSLASLAGLPAETLKVYTFDQLELRLCCGICAARTGDARPALKWRECVSAYNSIMLLDDSERVRF